MLSAKEKVIHEQGLVSILAQLHAGLDAAVADAYGWPADLPDEEILTRLVALNAARAAEEATGLIRWLRPEYQAAGPVVVVVETLHATSLRRQFEEAEPGEAALLPAPRPWPDGMAEQAAAVRAALASHAGRPVTPAELAAAFIAAAPARIAEWLATLVALGQARAADDGRFVAV